MASGENIAKAGFKYLNTLYSVMDCQTFIEKSLADCGIRKDLAGSNTWYRFVMQNGWTGTPEETKALFGSIPAGAFLFILERNGKEPEKYKKDGIGNASHIGLVTGQGQGAIHSSASRGCVAESKFSGKTINGGWNRVGLWSAIDYGEKINRILNGGGSSGGGGSKVTDSYQAKVIGGGLNLRAGKSRSTVSLVLIPDGTILTITETSGEWCRTSYEGHTGWVNGTYLEKIEDASGDGETVSVSRKELEAVYDQIGDWLGFRG